MKKYIPALLIIPALLFIGSCTKDFSEINTNPLGFTTASDGALFNGIIESLVLSGNEQFYINNEILYKQTQLAALTKDAWGNYTIGTEALWTNYYEILPSFRELEKRFNTAEPSKSINNMKAMLDIVFAYKTFKMTDLFGDMPVSKAGYGFQSLEYLHPEYDTQRDIYLSMLEKLRVADSLICDTTAEVEPFTSFKTFDKLFKGNLTMWQKFANSLRLRYAMRMVNQEPEIAGNIIKKIIEDGRPVLLGYDFVNPVLESACLWPLEIGYKNESLNWSFREHNGLRMGSNIWHQFSSTDSPSGSGIFDPRAYIFFETDVNNQWTPYPQIPDNTTPSSGGLPYESYRDDAANFTLKQNCNYSPFNYFLIRDQDYMPIILMTGAEVHFIKAEAYLRGIGVTQDRDMADIEYLNGILSSVKWWLNVAASSQLPISGVKFEDMITIPQNVNSGSVLTHFGSWNASNDEEFLGLIYTQCWIDMFRQPWDAYALTRRTGMTPREGDPINHFRMPYPPSEYEYNTVNCNDAISRQGGDSPQTKIWWAK
ncbi:MAG TPA: SusD/RagB family nutrient-binding outer membrane lipoprotein [Bacteroidales bacterium]|nr:SusD/RagB family nutrient-binding outer membrane lipoprotein [Bacteroidales bacterium]